MKRILLFSFLVCVYTLRAQTPMTPSASATTAGSDWNTTKITSDEALNFPWEITYGPDNFLWITERVGEKIVKVDPNAYTTTPTVLIDLSSKVEYSKQGGLMGMAIHPDLYNNIATTTNNYVYAAYTYDDAGTLRLRIVRLIYNNGSGTLSEDTSLNANGTILEGLPGSADHNSGRLIFGPDNKLYYTIGDQGANQFDYACNPVLSQVLPTSSTDYDNYPGKTLRINLDGSVPTDNPTLNGIKSHVYTYGHRNAQGIIFSNDGTLFASEHGAKVDDEINVIKEGKNYGWPEIAGYYDNMAYTYCNWSSLGGSCNASSFSDHNCPNGAETATEYESYPTLADVPSNFEPPIGTYGSTTATDPSGGWLTWPTVAPSGIDIHETGNIPGWGRSLLIPTLKRGTIYRAKLNADGSDIVSDSYEEFHSSNDRYRDVAISPDGLTIYAVTDNSGGTSGPSSTNNVGVTNPGLIVKIQYVGPQVTNPPVAICQDITVTLDPNGTATIVPADINNGSTGGSAGIDTIEIDRDTFTCSDVGNLTEVTLIVTDNDGNESRCTSTITVQPNANPAPFTAPTLDDIVSNCSITVDAPTMSTNGCVEITATTSDPVTYNAGESGTITWTFTDGTNTDTTTQNVTVNTLSVPTNFNVVPSSTEANITWDSIDDVTFNIRYREVGESTWLTEIAASNSITLTNLSLSTDYELQVNSDCGGSVSAYSTLVTFTTTALEYCAAQGASGGHISNVQIVGENGSSINNNSSGNATYTDFTSVDPVFLLSDGSTSYSLSVSTSYNASGVAVWIDLNGDGNFDGANEKVWDDASGTTANSPRTNSFTIPVSATAGYTRMRVASRQYWTPSGPCGTVVESGQDSEVEDYTVFLYNGLLYSNNIWSPNAPSDLTGAENAYILDGAYTVNSDIALNNLSVFSGATINVNKENALEVSGNVVNNGSLILNSDSNNFASLIVEGNVIGSVQYNRFVNSNVADNDLIAPPVSGQSFNDFVLNNNNVFNDGGGTYLFGPFDKASSSYLTYANIETAGLNAGTGYRTASTDAQPFAFQGSVTTSQVDVPIQYSGASYVEWNLIGNPYTSYIKLSDFLATNSSEFNTLSAGVYGYDADDSNGSNWTIWNEAYSTLNPNAVITPGQGFFVSSNSGGGNITFTPSMRAHASSDDFIAGRTNSNNTKATLRLQSYSGNFDTDIYILDNASIGLDIGYDARHLGDVSSTFALYSALVDGSHNDAMAIQALSAIDIANGTIIPLGVNVNQGEQFTFSLQDPNFGFYAYLEDTVANTFTLLNNMDYTFTPSSNLSGTGRFYLRIENSTLSVENPNVKSLHIYGDNDTKEVIVKGQLSSQTNLALFDIQGRIIIQQELDSNMTDNRISTEALPSGVYLVKVYSNQNSMTRKVIIE